MPNERVYVGIVPPVRMTAEELLHTSIPDKRVELIRGVLAVREPAGYRHGRVSMELASLLWQHVKGRGAGQVLSAETGFKLASDPDTVRAPDVAFITRERLPDPQTRGFPELGPDLVVEVLSPDDRPGETLTKVGDWLEGGARLVWVIDPERRVARVYRQDGTETHLAESGMLEGEDVLPGLSCTLTSIL
jgi:Uma2 family endonuclease